MPAKSYRDYHVWTSAMELAVRIYTMTEGKAADREALFGQLRGGAIAIPSKIAEGQQMQSDPHFIRCLYMAAGTLARLETQLILCGQLRLLPGESVKDTLALCQKVSMLLGGLLRKLLDPEGTGRKRDCRKPAWGARQGNASSFGQSRRPENQMAGLQPPGSGLRS